MNPAAPASMPAPAATGTNGTADSGADLESPAPIAYYASDDGLLRTAVFHMMTMPFTLRLRGAQEGTIRDSATKIRDFLMYTDRTLSPFRPDSLVSRANRGDWSGLMGNADFYEVYARTVMAADATDGHFTAMRDGRYDPVGLVKGWAIERAFDRVLRPLLRRGRAEAAVLGGGGDMQMGVREDSTFAWRIGIADPDHDDRLAGSVTMTDGAIATSGIAQRGEHIDHPGGACANDLVQASVICGSLTEADVMATAAMAAGGESFAELAGRQTDPMFAALTIDRHGRRRVYRPRATATDGPPPHPRQGHLAAASPIDAPSPPTSIF